jgi:hypothetical protein
VGSIGEALGWCSLRRDGNTTKSGYSERAGARVVKLEAFVAVRLAVV